MGRHNLRHPTQKSQNICDAAFEVKDFFEFYPRVLKSLGVFGGEPAHTLQLPPAKPQFASGKFAPEDATDFSFDGFLSQDMGQGRRLLFVKSSKEAGQTAWYVRLYA